MENNYTELKKCLTLRAGSRKFVKVNKFLFKQICEEKFQKVDQSGSKHKPNWMNITEAVHLSSCFTKEAMAFDFKQVQLFLTFSENRKTDWACPLFFSRYKIDRGECITWGEIPKMSEKQWTDTKMGKTQMWDLNPSKSWRIWDIFSAYFSIRCTLSE